MMLVVATFGAVSAIAAVMMLIAGLYVGMTLLLKATLLQTTPSWKAALVAVLGLLAYVRSQYGSGSAQPC
jgi:hypothetical protein